MRALYSDFVLESATVNLYSKRLDYRQEKHNGPWWSDECQDILPNRLQQSKSNWETYGHRSKCQNQVYL